MSETFRNEYWTQVHTQGRPDSPIVVHFKWSPCSIKTDFDKI